MAGITRSPGTVDIGRIALVNLVYLVLWMACVVRAYKRRVVRGICVASRANAACVAVIYVPKIVSKGRAQPVRRGVARRACAGDDSDYGSVRSEVIRYIPAEGLRFLPISGVTAVTISGRHSGADVAKVASHGDVRAGQWETCRAVVKDRAQPRSGCVARSASCWITGSDVIRHSAAEGCGALPLSRVAAVAVGGQRAAVIAIHVAQRAGHSGVGAGQWESCRAVIESRCRPIGGGMTDRAVRWKSRRNMIGHRAAKSRGALPCCQMAAIAGR